MRVTEVRFDGAPPVEGYGPGFFRISGAILQGPLALLPSGATAWRGFPDVEPFLAEREGFDVLFLGMGAETRPLDRELRARLEGAGIGVEVMSTPSACRTYNVLLSEGRRIAAGLSPI